MQVDYLRSLLELVVRKEPGLLPDFLPEVLELQARRLLLRVVVLWAGWLKRALTTIASRPQQSMLHCIHSPGDKRAHCGCRHCLRPPAQVDPSPAVRRYLADFIDAAVGAAPSPPVLAAALAGLRGLLGDGGGGAAVARRALQSCYPCYRAAYALVALRGGAAAAGDAAAALAAVWAAARELKGAAAALAGAAGAGEGVRQAALRFLEQAVMLLTAEVVPAVPGVAPAPCPTPAANAVTGGRVAVVREAEALLGQVAALVKQRAGEPGGVPPAVGAAAVRAAGGVAQQRPQFLGRLLPPLLALANATAAAGGGAAAAPPGGAASGGDDAVTAALKAALAGVARSTQPAARAWHKKVAAALQALGADDAVAAAPAAADRCGRWVARRREGWVLPACPVPWCQPDPYRLIAPWFSSACCRPEKRPSPALGAAEPAKRPRLDGQQAQQQQQQQQPLNGPLVAALPLPAAGGGAPPPPTPPEQLSKVLAVLEALVAARDAATLAGVVGGLQPAVLADVVLACMPRLPPRGALPPDGVPLEPWLHLLLRLVAEQAPLALPPPQGPGTVPPQQLMPVGPPQDVQQPAAAAAHQQQQQQQAVKAEARAPPPPPSSRRAPVPPPAAFRLEPLPLTEAQQASLRLAAVLRILRTHKTSRGGLRSRLVAKLAAGADAATAAAVLDQLVAGVAAGGQGGDQGGDQGEGGELEVALLWLSLLYARECRPAPADNGDDGGTGGSADAAAPGTAQQRRRQVGSAAGGRQGAPPGGDPAASAYEATLLALLRGLAEALPPSSRVIVRWVGAGLGGGVAEWLTHGALVPRAAGGVTAPLSMPPRRVLLEAPALPQPGVGAFLAALAERGPEWATLALLAARDVLLARPPARQALLQLVLQAAASPTADTRSKAVRLAANRLFPDPGMAPEVEAAARRRLDAMLTPPPAPQPDAAGSPAAPAAAAAEGTRSDEAQQQPQGEAAKGGGSPAGSPSAAAGAPEAAAADSEQQQQEQQQAEQPAAATGEGEAPPPTGPTDAEAAQLCALYCALCTKKHSLLRRLFEVYGQTSGAAGMCTRLACPALRLFHFGLAPVVHWQQPADGGR